MTSLGKRTNPPQGYYQPAEKRQRTNGQQPEPLSPNIRKQAITQMDTYLERFTNVKIPANAYAEVELRLGIASSKGKFRSGVTKDFFDEYRNSLIARDNFTISHYDDTDYSIKTHPDFNRITINNDNELNAMKKIPMWSPENISNRFRFDCRLSSAKEISLDKSIAPTDIPDYWSTRRRKIRSEFSSPNYFWLIHLTEVTTIAKEGGVDSTPSTTYEIEYELKDSTKLVDKQYRIDCIINLWDSILIPLMGGVIDRIECWLGEVPYNDIAPLQNLIWRSIRINIPGKGFPGSMPVSFSRRHIRNLQESRYKISEKTDGIRFMLLIIPSGAFLIGRKFDIHYICTDFGRCLLSLAGSGKENNERITLLDGELVETLKPRKYNSCGLTFMIFDVIKWQGISLADEPLTKRLDYISRAVSWYRNDFLQKYHKNHPFSFVGKKFFSKNEFSELQKQISLNEKNERIYDDKRVRCHKTDGFIITPDEPYSPKGTPNLYKWKYADLLSVDFRIISSQGVLKLACGGDDGTIISCRTLELSKEDDDKIKQILESKRQLCGFESDHHYSWLNDDNGTVIVELTYDPIAGMWRFHLERTDKNHPNHISVVFDTMEAISENITENELAQRIPCSYANDTWERL